MSGVSYGNVEWVGLVFRLGDGTIQTMEIQHPHRIDLMLTSRTVVRDFKGYRAVYDWDVEVTISGWGYGEHWAAGEQAAPKRPAGAIESGPPELEA